MAKIRLSSENKLTELAPRVTRTQTLDGGAVFVHSGFSHSDRTFDVKFNANDTNKTNLQSIIQTYALVRLALQEGIFIGSISSANFDKKIYSFTFLVSGKDT